MTKLENSIQIHENYYTEESLNQAIKHFEAAYAATNYDLFKDWIKELKKSVHQHVGFTFCADCRS